MTEIIAQHIQTIFPEMMVHPALFTHADPKKIILLGDQHKTIFLEASKHTNLCQISHETIATLKNLNPSTIDIIINANNFETSLTKCFFDLLHQDGILVQQAGSPFDIHALKPLIEHLKKTGFSDIQLLSFPQPDYTHGWRLVLMALKIGMFKRLREKIIFNKPFMTNYYNFDVHKAAMVLPEFIRRNIIF